MSDGRAARGKWSVAGGGVLLFLPWLALLGWFSAVAWFLCDDAFISFRYVRNLLEGHGLVFNPGEYVEGYTNFLWVLELAAIWGVLGVPPEQAAPWLSVVCTVGVIAMLSVWLARLPLLRHRRLVAWMAFGLLCSSATFAVWTSGGGLETRQFTLFTVAAVVCLNLWRDRRWGLAAASLSLALAAWTRPEGLLIGVLCIGWFAAQSMADAGRLRPDWRRLAWLAAPFVALVAAHYLFRYGYYGEWLPNAYYAKHVRPWYESGFRYLWAAALETGLYLLLPLAAVAARERWRACRDGAFALPLVLIGVHMAYVMRVGGDHFEYRPLDFYWPLLALPAAAGIVHLGSRLAAVRWLPGLGKMGARAWAAVVFAPVLFYAGAIQGTLLFKGAAIPKYIQRMHIELDDENAGWLLRAPGMPMLVAVSNDLRRLTARQSVASPFPEHRAFANGKLRIWKPYENMERGLIPDDALMSMGELGIRFYYLPDLKVIDRFGLTDATVARNPVARPNHERVMAHDRYPPPGYLEERGVNITVHPASRTVSEALMLARYAVQVGPDLWMPFDSPDEAWVLDRFAGRNLYVAPSLARFEDGFDGWLTAGEAVTNHGPHERYKGQGRIAGNVGGFLTSYHPDKGDKATGRAVSPKFTAESGQYLIFMIAGGRGDGVGVRLLADGAEVMVWRGENTERFKPFVYPLDEVARRSLQLELFDDETGSWGHIMLDHVRLAFAPR